MHNNRIEYISLASVVSALAVIFLHTNDCFWTFSTARYWFSANIIESVFYFAVPIFFMISGAMLIGYNDRYDLKTYFSKRFTKTVIPFIIWSFIGLAFQIFYLNNIKMGDVNLTYLINGLINGNLTKVYWFFIPLFCTYLAIPLFSLVPDDKRKEIFTYLATLGFILNILIPFIIFVFNLKISWGISIAASSGYLFFTLTGYLLHKYELKQKYKLILYLLAIIGLGMHIIGTYDLSIAAGKIVSTYKGYYNLPCALYSLGIFVFIKYDLVKLMKFDFINKIVNFLNYYTFGIYLIHWYLLEILIKTFNLPKFSIVFRLGAPFVILIISVGIIWIVRKIPIVEKIVP